MRHSKENSESEFLYQQLLQTDCDSSNHFW